MKIKFQLVFSLLLVCSSTLLAQPKMRIPSFSRQENDLTARVDAPKKDQNGDVCAIIKVVTPETGFNWEPDRLGIIAVETKVGEYWLYIPWGAKRLTIKHEKFGVLRDYMYPIPIEKATVYILELVAEQPVQQHLVIHTEPADASVYLNGQFVATGTYQADVKPGSCPYRVEAPLYHTESGKIEIVDSEIVLNVKLKPAFGYLSVTTTPEQDAKITIDVNLLFQTTPYQSAPLASGEYRLQVIKDMYQPSAQIVTVRDGQVTELNLVLKPNFANVNITAPTEAVIYINDERKGTGTWQGRLNVGAYSVKATLDNHRPAIQNIEVVSGDKPTIDLQPIPITGSLDVMTEPSGATIAIDGKIVGTSPNSISKLLIGDYMVVLNKVGYSPINKKVTINEGKRTELNEILINNTPIRPSGNSTVSDANNSNNQKTASKDCEEKEIGDFCFTNRKNFVVDLIYGKGPLFQTVADGKITIQPGQTSCLYELQDGAWRFYYSDPSRRVHTGYAQSTVGGFDDTASATVSGQFMVEKCKSQTLIIQ